MDRFAHIRRHFACITSYIALAALLMLAIINAGKIGFKEIDARLMKTVSAVSLVAFSITIILAVIKEHKIATSVQNYPEPKSQQEK